MRIPTILSDDIGGGQLNVEANPSMFGNRGLESVGHGLLNLSAGVGQVADVAIAMQKKKENDVAVSWSSSKLMEDKHEMTNFMMDLNKRASDTFADDLYQFANDRMAQTAAGSPSKQALLHYSTSMKSIISGLYVDAMQVQNATLVGKMKTGIELSISDALGSYRNLRALDPNKSLDDLNESGKVILGNIEQVFGKIAPTEVRKLQSQLISDFVIASADKHPEYALALLDGPSDLDESHRATLRRHVEQIMNSRDAVQRDSFDRSRRDMVTLAAEGKLTGTLPLYAYQAHYDDNRAIIEKREDDEKIRIYNGANKFMDKIAGYNANEMQSAIKDFHDNALVLKSGTDPLKSPFEVREMMKVITARSRDLLELQEKDRVGYLIQNNPKVSWLYEQSQTLPESGEREFFREALVQSIFEYQGHPPVGADPEESKRYLGLATNDHHIMSMDDARAAATEINKGSPGEVIQRIQSIMERYANIGIDPSDQDSLNKFQATAIADLVNLPGNQGIRQEYEVLWANRNAPFIDSLIGALSGTTALPKLVGVEQLKVDEALARNTTWNSFKSAMIGDLDNNADHILGYKNAVETLARSQMVRGKKPGEAINNAVRLLIGDNTGFTSVNGQTLVIPKKNPGKPDRTNEEIQDLGRRFGVALKYVDPRQIDQSVFDNALKPLGSQDRMVRLQALRDAITMKGFFQTEHDGRSATLYYQDDNGYNFQVTGKDGKPFLIYFDEIPDFTMKWTGPTTTFTPPQAYTQKEYPKKSYDLLAQPDNIKQQIESWFGTFQRRSNFPMAVDWMRSEPKDGPKIDRTGLRSTTLDKPKMNTFLNK